MIKHTDKPETTLIYSKNGCQKCMMTKRVLKSKGVPFEEINIQQGDEFEQYVDYLKGEVNGAAMPFVFPAKSVNNPRLIEVGAYALIV